MSELTTGGEGFPANWGIPSNLYNYETNSYDSGGYVWYGDDLGTRATDIQALYAWSDPVEPVIDVPTLFGLPPFSERAADRACYNQTVTLG